MSSSAASLTSATTGQSTTPSPGNQGNVLNETVSIVQGFIGLHRSNCYPSKELSAAEMEILAKTISKFAPPVADGPIVATSSKEKT